MCHVNNGLSNVNYVNGVTNANYANGVSYVTNAVPPAPDYPLMVLTIKMPELFADPAELLQAHVQQ